MGTGTIASGVATYSATLGTAGAHSLTAVYGGDANDAAATSTALAQTVNALTAAHGHPDVFRQPRQRSARPRS